MNFYRGLLIVFWKAKFSAFWVWNVQEYFWHATGAAWSSENHAHEGLSVRGLWKVLQEHDVCEETRENYSWWASFDAFCAFLTSKLFQRTTSSSVLTATSTLERAVKLISMLARSGRLESARVICKLKMWTKKRQKMAKSWGKNKNLLQNLVFDRNFLWLWKSWEF